MNIDKRGFRSQTPTSKALIICLFRWFCPGEGVFYCIKISRNIEATRQIDGFIGLTENHIEGIFIAKSARSKGIGRALLEYAKSRKPRLTLSVYQKNERALAFYRREQFTVQSEGIDEDTNEAELQMLWSRQA